LDDFDNGVGQLQVLVNGQLVADIPAGLNQLTGTGDYTAYTDVAVQFGPFDVTGFLVNGQNSVSFVDPLTGHSGSVRDVMVVQGTTVLLHVFRGAGVYPGHSVTYTFSTPPLVVSSFTITPTGVDQIFSFTAAYTDGTGPFTCTFRFGDGESATVHGDLGTCSTVHDYDYSTTFSALVNVRGASTSDLVAAHQTITVSSATITASQILGLQVLASTDDD
jgi:hypothetical protein